MPPNTATRPSVEAITMSWLFLVISGYLLRSATLGWFSLATSCLACTLHYICSGTSSSLFLLVVTFLSLSLLQPSKELSHHRILRLSHCPSWSSSPPP
ncbi:hypothetical protein B0T09DRAFT_328504 [Sordaria sp. MPI-SDFR-AT-0083]|nr:hypothetical protein B0T09DRAFT_328504 [Sordaria sp. MPI-SDFR-AT-0083]